MSLIKKLFIVSLILFFGFFLSAPKRIKALASSKGEGIVASTVEITNLQSMWTGTMIKRTKTHIFILSIIHDSLDTKMRIALGQEKHLVKINGNEIVQAHLLKWDPCTELALFVIEDTHKHPVLRIGNWNPSIGDKLLTAGNPIGEGIKYNEGYLSAKDNINKVCTHWSTYSGGTTSGQTGSPILNVYGKIIGILTAVSLQPNPVFDIETDEVIGMSVSPVFHMGYFVPLRTILGFIKSTENEKFVYLT